MIFHDEGEGGMEKSDFSLQRGEGGGGGGAKKLFCITRGKGGSRFPF